MCKWFVPEPGSAAALPLREAHIEGRIAIIAPQLLSYEVANALRYHPAISRTQLRTAIRDFFGLQIALALPSSESLSRAADFAHRMKVTIYDASYAVLAESHACPLITDDSRLLHTSELAISVSDWASSFSI